MPLDSSQQPLCSGIFQNRLLFNGLLARKDTSQIQAVITVSTDDTVSWAPAGKAEEQKSSGESRTKGQKLLPFVRQEMSDAARGGDKGLKQITECHWAVIPSTQHWLWSRNWKYSTYLLRNQDRRSSELEVVAELEQNQDEGSLIIYWWDPGALTPPHPALDSVAQESDYMYVSTADDALFKKLIERLGDFVVAIKSLDAGAPIKGKQKAATAKFDSENEDEDLPECLSTL
ncbi:hypothetical protein B0H11DRAFT_1903919 [Mycena galericulata]|nr:hypothetical protein B0H11DRAFT_1903919 [Mycena galericulata]